jgi:HAD superfamily hydrolase (TIGR01509 family)
VTTSASDAPNPTVLIVIRAVVFDLDGVLRQFDSATGVEADYGIPPGALEAAAFDPSILDDAVCGRITYEAWIAALGDLLAARHGESARAGAAAFGALPDRVDPDVLAIARSVRASCITAILTNGTTRVEGECERLGLTSEFDHLFNSARVGYAKPDRRVFEHALAALGVEPHECVFTDDSVHKLAGAQELGMHTIHFTGAPVLRDALRALGVHGI